MSHLSLISDINRLFRPSSAEDKEKFRRWQIGHYTKRLNEEQAKGNTAAVKFLRQELYNLRKPEPKQSFVTDRLSAGTK